MSKNDMEYMPENNDKASLSNKSVKETTVRNGSAESYAFSSLNGGQY